MKYGLLSINGPPIIEWYAGVLLLCIVVGVMMMMWIEYQDQKERRNAKAKERWRGLDEDGLYDYTWKTRDQYPTWVRGISAPVEFWTAIKDYGQSRGLNRSAAIVELVQQALGKKAQFSAANVGRPRKRTVKVQQ